MPCTPEPDEPGHNQKTLMAQYGRSGRLTRRRRLQNSFGGNLLHSEARAGEVTSVTGRGQRTARQGPEKAANRAFSIRVEMLHVVRLFSRQCWGMFTEVSIVVDKENEGTPEGAPCDSNDCALESGELRRVRRISADESLERQLQLTTRKIWQRHTATDSFRILVSSSCLSANLAKRVSGPPHR